MLDEDERFNAYLDKRGPDECWPWKSTLAQGYGRFRTGGVPRLAHRVAYERLVGPIPQGLHLDHLCHDAEVCNLREECPHRRCCNPAHLKPATPLENNLRSNSPTAIHGRKEECKNGHPYDEENTSYPPAGGRRCRQCHRDWERDRRTRKQAAAA